MTRSTSRPDGAKPIALEDSYEYLHGYDCGQESALANAVQEVCRAVVRMAAPIWRWGNGYGGAVHLYLDAAADEFGLATDDRMFVPPKRYEKIAARDGWGCSYCGTALGWGHESVSPPEVDHVTPRCQGGSDALDNLVLSCSVCNREKGKRTVEQWLADLALEG